jgi:hypothetical protein
MALTELFALPDGRRVLLLPGGPPCSFLLVDPVAGGVLVNTPRFDEARARALPPVQVIVLTSALGARDVEAWRTATGARTVAGVGEPVEGPVDLRADGTIRITGRLDFLGVSGVTPGTIALRSKGPPAIVFFGPALSHRGGWPVLVRGETDWDWENRVIGAVGIASLAFEYAYCDDYIHGESLGGPGADRQVAAALDTLLA